MGFVQISKNDQVSPELQDVLDNLMGYAESAMDDIGDIFQDAMEFVVPIGETGELGHLITVDNEGNLTRVIYSMSDHWDAVVGGHAVLGPIFSDAQRKWWFWYLNNVLGGEYTNKTDGYLPGNDFPLIAIAMGESDVDVRLDQFTDQIIGA